MISNEVFLNLVQTVRDVLDGSIPLHRLGLSVVRQEFIGATQALDARCCFILRATESREVGITFLPPSEDDGHIIVVLRDTDRENASFFLEDWLKLQGRNYQPDPFILKHYHGSSFKERLESFMLFLEEQLSTEPVTSVLEGDAWPNVPFDWGGLR